MMLKQLFGYTRIFALTHSLKITRILISSGSDIKRVKRINSDELYLPELDMNVNLRRQSFILESYETLMELVHHAKANLSVDKEGHITIKIGSVIQYIENREEIAILGEIYLKNVYNFEGVSEGTVVDIGMNVGFSTLYFASKGLNVIGYEPITPTFNQALENLNLNPELKERIKPVNVGLGKTTRVEQFEFCTDMKGCVGVGRSMKNISQNCHLEKGTIVDVKDALGSILKMEGGHVIIKIDCEGSEYEIFDRLFENDLLFKPRLILLEWHIIRGNEDIEKLKNQLIKSNFDIVMQSDRNKKSGMIYAFQRTGRSAPLER